MSFPYPSRRRSPARLVSVAFAIITCLSMVLPAHATFSGANGEIVVQTTRPVFGSGTVSRSALYILNPDTGIQIRPRWLEGPEGRVPWHSTYSQLRFEPGGLRFLGLLNDGKMPGPE